MVQNDPRVQAMRRQRDFQPMYERIYAMILHGLESGASIAVTAQRMADVLVERFEAETELLRTVVKRQAEEIERLTGEMDKHTHTGERHGNAVEDAWFVLGDPAGS